MKEKKDDMLTLGEALNTVLKQNVGGREVDLEHSNLVAVNKPESGLVLKLSASTMPYSTQLADTPEEKDIEYVMTQCSVTREKAVSALGESEGDITNAILALLV